MMENKNLLLGICGSPRKQGTDYALNYALQYAKDKFGFDTEFWSVRGKNLMFCTHCNYCIREKKGCINEDDTLKEGALPLGTVKSIDYKVSKTRDVIESNAYQFILDVQGPEFSCIAKYIDDHKDEIELKVMDYGDLQPMLGYFCRNS